MFARAKTKAVLILLAALALGACGGTGPAPVASEPSASAGASTPSPAPPDVPSPSPPSGATLDFVLVVNGTPPAGDVLQLYFQLPHAGQTLFELCGYIGPPCAGHGQRLHRAFAISPSAGRAPYRFERVESRTNRVTVISSGTVATSESHTVEFAYSYP